LQFLQIKESQEEPKQPEAVKAGKRLARLLGFAKAKTSLKVSLKTGKKLCFKQPGG